MDEEERSLLFEMSAARVKLAVVGADVTKQAAQGGRSAPCVYQAVMHCNPTLTERPPIRCDHCRKPLGQPVYRYFRMRFCSTDCLMAYQARLDRLTRVKIARLGRPRTSKAA
jgi:hypothetical protein